MSLWIAFALITLATVALVAYPLLQPRPRPRRAAVADRADYDMMVYRDQLAEVDRDLERGMLTAEQAQAVRIEVKRRMLAAAEKGEKAAAAGGSRWPVVAAIAVMLPLGAGVMYASLGAPGLPDLPYAERRDTQPDHEFAQFAGMVDTLAERLKNEPENVEGWLMLARSAATLGRYGQSAAAYRRALRLGADDAQVRTGLGEALVAADDGAVGPEAREQFAAALRLDPANPKARYYVGFAHLQNGEGERAVAIWRGIVEDAPEAPYAADLRERIRETAAEFGLDADKIASFRPDAVPAAAAGLDAGQKRMVEEMVSGLAAKLEADPEDYDGWMRLGRSYLVLERSENAKQAYAKAAALKPSDVESRMGLAEAMLAGLGEDTTAYPAEFVTVMRDIQALEPGHRDALFYLGLAEAQSGNRAAARDWWRKLLAELPADSPARTELQKRLDALGS